MFLNFDFRVDRVGKLLGHLLLLIACSYFIVVFKNVQLRKSCILGLDDRG